MRQQLVTIVSGVVFPGEGFQAQTIEEEVLFHGSGKSEGSFRIGKRHDNGSIVKITDTEAGTRFESEHNTQVFLNGKKVTAGPVGLIHYGTIMRAEGLIPDGGIITVRRELRVIS